MPRPVPDTYRKSWAGAPPGFYTVEAAGLRWLAEGASVRGTRIVEVRDVGDEHIDLEALVAVGETARAVEKLGRSLARLHGLGAPSFGSPPPGWHGDAWIGRQTQTNEPTPTWGEFYAEQRVRPFVRRAVRAGNLDRDGARLVERVCDRIAVGSYDDGRAPARVHGDLWAGNVVFTDRGAVLIDPAAHGGHGLTDLAMLALFGVPWLDRLGEAYAEVAGLDCAWRPLMSLHQLHPLATHAASQGPAYAEQLVQAARRWS